MCGEVFMGQGLVRIRDKTGVMGVGWEVCLELGSRLVLGLRLVSRFGTG